jgi:putative membrane protein
MNLDATLAYLHFLCIFGVFAVLSMEAVLLRPALIASAGRWIAKLDLAYFIVAILTLASGLSRAIWGIKGWAFYAHQPAFHIKLGLFLLIGLISIAPTRIFLRWTRGFRNDPAYAIADDELKRTRRLVIIEVHLLLLLPLCAVIMARGL